MTIIFDDSNIGDLNITNQAATLQEHLNNASPRIEKIMTDTPIIKPDIERQILPEKFVYVQDIIPNIKINLKYATTDNFTGKVVDGYESTDAAIMTLDATNALKLVQEELNSKGYGLLIWDTYRPVQAVQAFLKWKDVKEDPIIRMKYFPTYKKQDLFDKGYISGRSTHSRGSTIDLTIIDLETGRALDMGTDFDFFGQEAHPSYQELPLKVIENRNLLKDLMIKHGFKGITLEWWHFIFENEPFKEQYFDFPVK